MRELDLQRKRYCEFRKRVALFVVTVFRVIKKICISVFQYKDIKIATVVLKKRTDSGCCCAHSSQVIATASNAQFISDLTILLLLL